LIFIQQWKDAAMPETRIETLRAALVEGEQSGASSPFDFDAFVTEATKQQAE
jgi:Arc/MetJ-type ribon-helix-helix transcriptional regulator